MGICKCRKRTELCTVSKDGKSVDFVCSDCIVAEEYATAQVIFYKDWLSNSQSKGPLVCPLSKAPLDDGANLIRLMNFQLFRLDAIIDYASKLPENSTPSIPGTQDPLAPSSSDNSKLAQQIRKKLSTFAWFKPPQTIPQPITATTHQRNLKSEERIDIPEIQHTVPAHPKLPKKNHGRFKRCCISLKLMTKKERSKEYTFSKRRVGLLLLVLGAFLFFVFGSDEDPLPIEDDIKPIPTVAQVPEQVDIEAEKPTLEDGDGDGDIDGQDTGGGDPTDGEIIRHLAEDEQDRGED